LCGVAVSGEGDGSGKEIEAVYGLGDTEGLGRVMGLGMEMGWWREKGWEGRLVGKGEGFVVRWAGGTWASEGDGFGDGDGLGEMSLGREMGCGRGMDLGSEIGWGLEMGWGKEHDTVTGWMPFSKCAQTETHIRVHKTHKSENSVSATFHSVHLVDTKILQRYG